MKPKFKVGAQVAYRGKLGTVHTISNEGDKEDIRAQGHRYEVYFAATGLHSIPESFLDFPANHKNSRTN